LAWGIVATWWLGLLLGVALATVARVGHWPKRSAASLVPPMMIMLLVIRGAAAAMGVLAYVGTGRGWISVPEPWATTVIAPHRHARFMAAAAAHSTSYAVGVFAAVGLVGRILWWRQAAARADATPKAPK